MHQRFTNPPDFYVSSLGVCVRNPAAQRTRSIFSVTEADFEDFDELPDLPPLTSTPPPSAPPPPDFTRLISTVTKHAARLQAENAKLRDALAEYKARDKQASAALEARALETAFDPEKNAACIGLSREVRDNASAWLPPGMAYVGEASGTPEDEPQADSGAAKAGSGDETGLASSDLPAFLTEDEDAALEA
jgi:hypothetical protein